VLGRPEFHAEWLRDEPCDATATDPGSYIPGAWCQLSPGNGEHGIRHASRICILNLFFLFPEKEAFVFQGQFFRLVLSYSLKARFKVAKLQGFKDPKSRLGRERLETLKPLKH
jgi:hypothetical protein